MEVLSVVCCITMSVQEVDPKLRLALGLRLGPKLRLAPRLRFKLNLRLRARFKHKFTPRIKFKLRLMRLTLKLTPR